MMETTPHLRLDGHESSPHSEPILSTPNRPRMSSSIDHVTRVRWKWLFGIAFVVYGAYALVQRWIFWRWDSDWKITDLLVEPGSLLLGTWLIVAALRGTRERLSYGAVTVRTSPCPARPGMAMELVVQLPSGIAAGEVVQLALVRHLAEPDSDGVNYTQRWRLERDVAAESIGSAGQGVTVKTSFELPPTPAEQIPTGQNYELLTLHVSHPRGLDREFALDWHWQG